MPSDGNAMEIEGQILQSQEVKEEDKEKVKEEVKKDEDVKEEEEDRTVKEESAPTTETLTIAVGQVASSPDASSGELVKSAAELVVPVREMSLTTAEQVDGSTANATPDKCAASMVELAVPVTDVPTLESALESQKPPVPNHQPLQEAAEDANSSAESSDEEEGSSSQDAESSMHCDDADDVQSSERVIATSIGLLRWTAEDEEGWNAENSRDYYAALNLSRTSQVSTSRVRAAYHRLAVKWNKRLYGQGISQYDPDAQKLQQEALRRFWVINEAYLVLKDPERKRVYDECGLSCLRQSEACYAESVFEKDAFEVYERFFSGDDPEERDFLLMNGSADWSEDEDDDDEADEVQRLAEEAFRAAREAADSAHAQGPEAAGAAAAAALAGALEASCAGQAKSESIESKAEPEAHLPPDLRSKVVAGAGLVPAATGEKVLDSKWSSLIDTALARVPPALAVGSPLPDPLPVNRTGCKRRRRSLKRRHRPVGRTAGVPLKRRASRHLGRLHGKRIWRGARGSRDYSKRPAESADELADGKTTGVRSTPHASPPGSLAAGEITMGNGGL